MGFGVSSLRLGVWGLGLICASRFGFRVWGLGFTEKQEAAAFAVCSPDSATTQGVRLQTENFVYRFEFRNFGSGFALGVQGSEFQISGFGFRDSGLRLWVSGLGCGI